MSMFNSSVPGLGKRIVSSMHNFKVPYAMIHHRAQDCITPFDPNGLCSHAEPILRTFTSSWSSGVAQCRHSHLRASLPKMAPIRILPLGPGTGFGPKCDGLVKAHPTALRQHKFKALHCMHIGHYEWQAVHNCSVEIHEHLSYMLGVFRIYKSFRLTQTQD